MSEIGLRKEQLDTPVLWVDLGIMENNIATLAAHFKDAGIQWRPHVKGVKIPAIAHKIMAAGAIGVTCAKLGEAEVMGAAGITDILIANQVVGPHKTLRLANLSRYTAVKVVVDSEANITELSRSAGAKGVEIGILVDVDTGMQRTGVAPGDEAVTLSRLVHATPGLCYLGLMSWEGHTLLNKDPESKNREIVKAVGLLIETADYCREVGLSVAIVSAGGSGTYKVTPFLPGITETQAGGAIFCDVVYESWGVETTPSLFVRTIVTSRPAPDRIVFDAGYKTMPVWHAQPKPIGIDGIRSYVTSAEHGVITLYQSNTDVKVGDIFDFVIGYTDATLFLHDALYGIRDGVVEVVWDIVGRGKLR